VTIEFLDAGRTPAAVQIGRCGADDRVLCTNTPPDQAGMISRIAKPHHKVNAFLDEVDPAVREGDTTGGVALFGLQIAQTFGARTIVTSRSAEKLERAKAMGASAVIDTSSNPEWSVAALELTDGRGVDHVLEIIGATISASQRRPSRAAVVFPRLAS
jgi:hypothetical protein